MPRYHGFRTINIRQQLHKRLKRQAVEQERPLYDILEDIVNQFWAQTTDETAQDKEPVDVGARTS